MCACVCICLLELANAASVEQPLGFRGAQKLACVAQQLRLARSCASQTNQLNSVPLGSLALFALKPRENQLLLLLLFRARAPFICSSHLSLCKLARVEAIIKDLCAANDDAAGPPAMMNDQRRPKLARLRHRRGWRQTFHLELHTQNFSLSF